LPAPGWQPPPFDAQLAVKIGCTIAANDTPPVAQEQKPAAVHSPDTHWSEPVHGAPLGSWGTQVPAAPGFMQKSDIRSQSPSEVQAVLHAVGFAQTTPPGHAVEVPVAQEPVPVQMELVTWPALHEAPHGVPAVACSQAPPVAQLPLLPHGGSALHWPAGAGMPAITAPHVPVALPVSSMVQA
jgi:hypothetical protein